MTFQVRQVGISLPCWGLLLLQRKTSIGYACWKSWCSAIHQVFGLKTLKMKNDLPLFWPHLGESAEFENFEFSSLRFLQGFWQLEWCVRIHASWEQQPFISCKCSRWQFLPFLRRRGWKILEHIKCQLSIPSWRPQNFYSECPRFPFDTHRFYCSSGQRNSPCNPRFCWAKAGASHGKVQ